MKPQLLITAALCSFLALGAQAQATKISPKDKEIVQKEMGKATRYRASMKPNKFIPISEHYEGGMDSLYVHIDKKINYPMMARRNRLQGECIIALTLNADGSTSNFKIVTNKGGTLGEEALRIVQTLKFKAPGYTSQYSMPVIFRL